LELNILDNDGEITATGKDLSGHGFNPTACKIEGFYDEGLISFLKQYEKGLTWDENGNTIVLPDENNYEINYSGNYNNDTKEFEGDWEVAMYYQSEDNPDLWIQQVGLGTWKMHKV
jgi:hypothetical protein